MAQMSDLIDQQEPQRLATGFQFTEGPVWHPDGYLLFSDIPPGIIYRWTPGGITAFLTPSRRSNGLIFDRQGRLVACEHDGRQVSRMAGDGQMVTVTANYQGKRLNSPNDIVEHSSGRIYFTDPHFGITKETSELGFFGVFRVDPDGKLTLLVSDPETSQWPGILSRRVHPVCQRHFRTPHSGLRCAVRRLPDQ